MSTPATTSTSGKLRRTSRWVWAMPPQAMKAMRSFGPLCSFGASSLRDWVPTDFSAMGSFHLVARILGRDDGNAKGGFGVRGSERTTETRRRAWLGEINGEVFM